MVGSAPELTFVIGVALAVMFYLVPHRRRDALLLMASSLAIAGVTLLALGNRRWVEQATISPFSGWYAPRWTLYAPLDSASWVLVTVAAVAVAAYAAVRRARYFGNTAPLLVVALTVVLGLPHNGYVYSGPFPAWSLPLLFVFVGGIVADLAETDLRRPALLVFVVLAASLAVLDLLAVAQHPTGGGQLSSPERFRRTRI
jgi:hypothetical protein